MLEYTSFNNWFYGTSVDALEKDKINIGVFNPEGIRNLLDRNDIELIVCKIKASDKTRLIRQLTREINPNVQEIIRRFGTDADDFALLDFDYITIENDKEDLFCALPSEGQENGAMILEKILSEFAEGLGQE